MLTKIGDLEVGKMLQLCALLSADMKIEHVSLEDILHENSADTASLHAEYITECLRDGVEVPAPLVTNLVEKKMEERGEAEKWMLISGYPAKLDHLVDFEKMVKQKLLCRRASLILIGTTTRFCYSLFGEDPTCRLGITRC